MPLEVIVETGSGTNPAANSLASVAEIDAIAESSLSMPNWEAEEGESDNKKKAVISATTLFKRWVPWLGAAVVNGQPLPFPRVGCVDYNRFPIMSNTVPALVKEALALMAEALLEDAEREEDPQTGMVSLAAGSLRLAFDKYDRPGVLPRSVKAALAPVADFGSSVFGKAKR